MTRVALVPGVLALLPEHAAQVDPVAELRAAALGAVRWLGDGVTVIADPQGERVGRHLLDVVGLGTVGFETVAAQPPQPAGGGFETVAAQPPQPAGGGFETVAAQPPQPAGGGFETVAAQPPQPAGGGVLVVGNGSATRSEKAPGHLDERSFNFDEALGAALRSGDLGSVDWSLAEELWASVDNIHRAAELISGPATVDYDDDPYGVQYWVMRWGA